MNIRKFVKQNRHFGWQNAAAVRRLTQVHYNTVERSYIAKQISKHAQRGYIGMIIDATDCDMYRTRYASVKKANITLLWSFMQQMYNEAEGPVSISFCSPDVVVATKRTSRDMALEAFEDGHTNVVYY